MNKIVHYLGLDVHKESGREARRIPRSKIQIPDKLQKPNFNGAFGVGSCSSLRLCDELSTHASVVTYTSSFSGGRLKRNAIDRSRKLMAGQFRNKATSSRRHGADMIIKRSAMTSVVCSPLRRIVGAAIQNGLWPYRPAKRHPGVNELHHLIVESGRSKNRNDVVAAQSPRPRTPLLPLRAFVEWSDHFRDVSRRNARTVEEKDSRNKIGASKPLFIE
jgi:hypothetical protein